MSLINPIWLWVLSALAIPIGIHLLSRKEGKTIRIGSVRFLTETSTSKFSSLRLNEVFLLALRSLLIILIVLFLAGLILYRTDSKTSRKWALVEKSVGNQTHIRTLFDSLQKNGFEIRKLEPGFALLDDDTAQTNIDYYKLTEALSKESDLQAVIFATSSLPGFKGKRISLPDNITWIAHPASTMPNAVPSDLTSERDTLHITIVNEKDFQDDKNIIKAALHAIESVAPKKIILTETNIQDYKPTTGEDWVIWLSNEKPPVNGKYLYFREDILDQLIAEKTKNNWVLTKRLTVGEAVEQHLPIQLTAMLFSNEIKTKMISKDKRTVPNELAWSNAAKIQSGFTTANSKSVDNVLLLCISLLFVSERILSFYRKQ